MKREGHFESCTAYSCSRVKGRLIAPSRVF
jgi:hypothetical protein